MGEIRQITLEEFEQAIALHEFSFQVELDEHARAERRERFFPEENWGYFINGNLAAKLAVLPFKMLVQEKVFAAASIDGVATWAEFRRQGMVGNLMLKAIESMKNNGQTVSTLTPFSYPFYRNYGWETFMERRKYDIHASCLPKFPSHGGYIERVAIAEYWTVLQLLYEEFAKKFNGMVQRDENWWIQRVSKTKSIVFAICYNKDRVPRGYIVYQVRNRHFAIKEFVFLDEEARMELWSFIAKHNPMIDRVTLIAPLDDELLSLLNEPQVHTEIITWKMVRIVDVKAFMEQYPFQATGKKHCLSIRVEDKCASWNNGTFQIIIDEQGHAQVIGPVEPQTIEVNASCHIQALTALFVSCRNADWLRVSGQFHCQEQLIKQLEEILPERSVFLLDGF